MARTPVPIVTIPHQKSVANLKAQGVSADTANNHTLLNDGKVELWAFGRAAGAVQVTVVSVSEPRFGRTGDLVDSVIAGEDYTAGPFDPGGFNQPGGSLINIDVDTTDAAFILVGVRRSNASL